VNQATESTGAARSRRAFADPHILTGAYALNALDPAEDETFRHHLAGCRRCAQEARELAETAARLGAAAGSPVPPELRARVLHWIGTVRQLPPLPPGSAGRG